MRNMLDDFMRTSVQSLLDHRAIEDLVVRYCRASDRHDWQAMAELYHDDAQDDHGSLFQGSARDFVAWLPGMAGKFISTWHQINNHLIEVHGDHAEGEVYVVARHVKAARDGGTDQIVTGGRYLDRYEKREGRWKFLRRKAVMDWNDVRPCLTRWPADGGHGQNDPSHGWFEFLGKR